jgi:hypothetical protein
MIFLKNNEIKSSIKNRLSSFARKMYGWLLLCRHNEEFQLHMWPRKKSCRPLIREHIAAHTRFENPTAHRTYRAVRILKPPFPNRSQCARVSLVRFERKQSTRSTAGRAPARPRATNAPGGEDEWGGAMRGADGVGIRRGGLSGRGRTGVAVPVRGGAPAAGLDLLLPPPLQRPLPVPPRAVSELNPAPASLILELPLFPLSFL